MSERHQIFHNGLLQLNYYVLQTDNSFLINPAYPCFTIFLGVQVMKTSVFSFLVSILLNNSHEFWTLDLSLYYQPLDWYRMRRTLIPHAVWQVRTRIFCSLRLTWSHIHASPHHHWLVHASTSSSSAPGGHPVKPHDQGRDDGLPARRERRRLGGVLATTAALELAAWI
jgi:hypothetical protein